MNSPYTSSPAQTERPRIQWFVMTFVEASYLLNWLSSINVVRLSPTSSEDDTLQRAEKSKNVITTFYPYEFLRNRETKTIQKPAEEDSDLAFRLFRHIIFIRTTKADAARLVASKDNLDYPIRLRFYQDTDGHAAVVPDRMMDDFISACIRHNGSFRLVPSIHKVKATDKVRIEEGPFEGQEATVTKVVKSRRQITLELNIPLVNGALNIRLENVKRHQVAILGDDKSETIRADFIDYTQRHLLTILANRIHRVQDRERCRRDAEMLDHLYRFRSYEVDGDAAQTHFLALMLICAHLCKDATGEKELTDQALERLAAINTKSESRANTDIRTYLWIALYIATGETDYSRLAKRYVQERQPKSRHLRRFVNLIRKGRKV